MVHIHRTEQFDVYRTLLTLHQAKTKETETAVYQGRRQ